MKSHQCLTYLLVDDSAGRNFFGNFFKLAVQGYRVHGTNRLCEEFEVEVVLAIVVFFAARILVPPVVHDHHVLVGDLLDNALKLILVRSVFLPPVLVLNMYDFPLQVAAVDGALSDIQLVESVNQQTRNALGVAQVTNLLKVGSADLQGFDKVANVHGVLAGVVEEELQVEGLVVAVGVVVVVAVGHGVFLDNFCHNFHYLVNHILHECVILFYQLRKKQFTRRGTLHWLRLHIWHGHRRRDLGEDKWTF